MRGVEQIPWMYDGMMAVSERLGLLRWRRWLALGASGRALEVGCGTGRNLPLYATKVIGIDPSPDAVRKARKRAPGVPLVIGSAEALPFRDGVFDTVVSSLVFCSVPDPARGLAEARRVLRPEGRLRMMEHVRAVGRFGGRVQDLLQPVWTRVTGGCHPNRRTEETVEAAGFQIERETRRARGTMRRFSARVTARAALAGR
jgi:SAM-dependent methyltransferase